MSAKKRLPVTCDTCGIVFERKLHWIKKNKKNFCSRDCYWADMNKNPRPGWSKGMKAKDDPRIRAGNNNGMWTGGRQITNGYIQVLAPGHPFADERGRIYEHRLKMEEYLGRYLTEDETVHHINGIKTDNEIENLSLETNKTHRRTHAEVIKENRRLRVENQRLLTLLALIIGANKSGEVGHDSQCR